MTKTRLRASVITWPCRNAESQDCERKLLSWRPFWLEPHDRGSLSRHGKTTPKEVSHSEADGNVDTDLKPSPDPLKVRQRPEVEP